LLCSAKINEETGDDPGDIVMFDDVDGEEDDIDDVSSRSVLRNCFVLLHLRVADGSCCR